MLEDSDSYLDIPSASYSPTNLQKEKGKFDWSFKFLEKNNQDNNNYISNNFENTNDF